MGRDEPFKTGGTVIEANIDGMNPTPPAVLEPVKDSGEAIREGVKIIGGVDGSCKEGQESDEEKGCGEDSAKRERVFVRSAGGEEAGPDFVKRTESKQMF